MTPLFSLPSQQQRQQIIKLSLPILGGYLSLNLFWLIDIAMIGVLGTTSLAAVGFAGFLSWLTFSPFFGIVSALQTITARRLGENNLNDLIKPLHAGLIVISLLALIFATILIYFSQTIFNFLSSDPAVISEGVTYFQIRMLSLICFGINVCFRGFWSGMKEPYQYYNFLYVIHGTNILLNWVLIYGNLGFTAMGSEGAAWATSLSLCMGTCYYLISAYLKTKPLGFLKRKVTANDIKTLITLGFPLGLEEFLYASSFSVFLAILDKLGTVEVAVANVIRHISLFLFLPGRAFGIATASLVSESIGKKQYAEAKQWPLHASKLVIIIPLLLGMGFIIFSKPLLALFLHDPHAHAMAQSLLTIDSAYLWSEAVYLVFLGGLIGVGASRHILLLCFLFQWCIFLPTAFIIGPFLGFPIIVIWWSMVVINVFKILTIIIIWQRINTKKYFLLTPFKSYSYD
ncbi:hypothetical protein DID76_01440 [Candidatus Marinamargulisbacteria bacterium SCGC AG-414-C22]|nr:hypothetical protein DID76_01440 [Candidatus Marinamargulisbacteria bacterium SCGC AG-414-C22]